jgi:HSP20 family protein
MSNLRVFDPLFNDNFESAFRRFFPAVQADADGAALKMRIDVTESDKAYAVKADIPGVRKEDIKIDVEGSQVSIVAETKHESEEKKDGKLLRSERYYGQQARSFTLAHDIDESKVSAKYAEGVLELTLPKKAGRAARQISVA